MKELLEFSNNILLTIRKDLIITFSSCTESYLPFTSSHHFCSIIFSWITTARHNFVTRIFIEYPNVSEDLQVNHKGISDEKLKKIGRMQKNA